MWHCTAVSTKFKVRLVGQPSVRRIFQRVLITFRFRFSSIPYLSDHQHKVPSAHLGLSALRKITSYWLSQISTKQLETTDHSPTLLQELSPSRHQTWENPRHLENSMVVVKCCLMSSDVSWHIRDKLWPMPKHGSIILYVHGNQKAR